jgi:hypothetical protein
MLIHLETQSDLDDAIHRLVDQDRRLRPAALDCERGRDLGPRQRGVRSVPS